MLLSNRASKLQLSYTKIAQLLHSPLVILNITHLAYYKFLKINHFPNWLMIHNDVVTKMIGQRTLYQYSDWLACQPFIKCISRSGSRYIPQHCSS